ncbi:MAG: DUF488 domain-containing protein [Candidatus Dadabacteria bacterium]|nr:DUF488 domain-containing protein [Candidatus Dadabacteria bacterium]
MSDKQNRKTIHSIGHSNRGLDEFIAALEAHGIETLADVRSYPVSRRYPHFSREALSDALTARGIKYVWMPGLGGRRDGGYETYMKTAEFPDALVDLEEIASRSSAAFMCSELRWRECHRAFIADALHRNGWHVVHIYGGDETEVHSVLPLV